MTSDKVELRRAPPDSTVELLEEKATVAIHDVTTGRVRISTEVETFEQIVHAALQTDVVDVTRVSRNIPVVGPPPEARTEGDVTIIPVFEEILVVEKRLMLKEELRIRRRTDEETIQLPVTLRRQTASVERSEVAPPDSDG